MMLHSIRTFLCSVIPCLVAGDAALAANLALAPYDGAWTGTLRLIDPSSHNPVAGPAMPKAGTPIEIAIEIEGNEIHVYVREGSAWEEVKPGAFVSLVHLTNAIVAAADSRLSPNGEAGWVESWNFSLTRKDADIVYAYWVRAVNNFHLPADNPQARFFMSAFGELRRSEPIAAVNRNVIADAGSSECRSSELVCGQ